MCSPTGGEFWYGIFFAATTMKKWFNQCTSKPRKEVNRLHAANLDDRRDVDINDEKYWAKCT